MDISKEVWVVALVDETQQWGSFVVHEELCKTRELADCKTNMLKMQYKEADKYFVTTLKYKLVSQG